MVTFQRLGLLLNKRDKKLLVLLVVFSIYISIMETVGISAIVPLISAANDPNFIEKNRYMAVVYRFFSFDSSVQFILYYGMAIIAFYLIRIFSNTLYFYSLGRFTYHKYYGISGDIYKKYKTI
jgi:ABC-type multidrug transport system fused ATPase/permease subunit